MMGHLLQLTPVAAAERVATVVVEAFACTSWAGWRDYSQASLTPRGARANRHCPERIRVGQTVVVIDGDAGFGAAQVRWRGKEWFIDEQRLK